MTQNQMCEPLLCSSVCLLAFWDQREEDWLNNLSHMCVCAYATDYKNYSSFYSSS
jgi:hypothetical protein